jgi:hypothetical protein
MDIQTEKQISASVFEASIQEREFFWTGLLNRKSARNRSVKGMINYHGD